MSHNEISNMVWITICNGTTTNSILKECGMQPFLIVIDGLACLPYDILKGATDLFLRISSIVVGFSSVLYRKW